MVFRGLDVHPKKFNGFARRGEADAGIGEHNNSEGDEHDGDDGFSVHKKLRNSDARFAAGNKIDQHHDEGNHQQDEDENRESV